MSEKSKNPKSPKTALVLYSEGVTLTEAALLVLLNSKPLTRSELADAIHLSRSRISLLVSNMIAKNLIVDSRRNRRSNSLGLIKLTKRGIKIANLP